MAADELTQECWRIAERLGQPTPDAVKLWETVRDELSHTSISFPKASMSVAVLMKRWKETNNPYFVDAAVSVCHAEGVAPTEAMIKEITDISLRRMRGSFAGTSEKVLKEGLLDKLLVLIMNLVVTGYPLATAASKAQQWQEDNAKNMPHYKASVLERRYTERMRKTGIESDFRDSVNQWEDWHRPTWIKIGDAMPEVSKQRAGERR